MEEQPVAEFIKIQDIPKGELVIANTGGKIENGVEYLDLQAEDPISYVPFSELINVKAPHNLPYILAVVSYKQGPEAMRHSYYDARNLNETVYGKITVTKLGKNRKFAYDFTKNQNDPYSRTAIDDLTYFAIDPTLKTAKFIGTGSQIKRNSKVLTRLFHENIKLDKELEKVDKNPRAISMISEKIKALYKLLPIHIKN